MARITIPVVQLEFEENGNTLWVQGPVGTVLRIKLFPGKFTVSKCESNPCSHLDLMVKGDNDMCLGPDEGLTLEEFVATLNV